MSLSDDSRGTNYSRESNSLFEDEAGLIENTESPSDGQLDEQGNQQSARHRDWQGDRQGDRQNDKQRGKQSRLISKVLAPAIRLWLKSQLEAVEDLQIGIEAGDRQLLSGGISQVSASAQKAVYQGLHLSQINVVGQNIQTNLPQVLRGKPFRLLEAFPVTGDVALSAVDLNASLQAPLLSKAVIDFLLGLLRSLDSVRLDSVPLDSVRPDSVQLEAAQIELGTGELTFKVNWVEANGQVVPVVIRAGLAVHGGNTLVLEPFQCWMAKDGELAIAPNMPDRFSFNLGSDVYLETLTLQANQIVCRGKITVIP